MMVPNEGTELAGLRCLAICTQPWLFGQMLAHQPFPPSCTMGCVGTP